MLLERGADRGRGLEDGGAQLLRALLEWTQGLLEALTRGLELQLTQLLFDGSLASALLFLGPALLAQALLLGPQLLLNHALSGGLAALLQAQVGLGHLQAPPLLGGPALLGQELRAELEHADPVAQAESLAEDLGSGSTSSTPATTRSTNSAGTDWPVAASRRAESVASRRKLATTVSRMIGKSAS